MRLRLIGLAAAALMGTFAACADIEAGAILSLTGPVASLGIPEKNLDRSSRN